MRLEEGLVVRLKANASLISLAGEGSPLRARVYHLQLPQNATLPAITYQRVSTTQGEILDGADTLTDVRIQIDAWANSVKTTKDIADAVRASLSGFRGAMSTVVVQRTKFESEIDLADITGDQRTRRVSMDFIFTLHET